MIEQELTLTLCQYAKVTRLTLSQLYYYCKENNLDIKKILLNERKDLLK